MMPAPPTTSKEDKEREERWAAESDLRSLCEAAKIKADKKRLRRAMDLAKEQMAELKKVSD